MVPYLYNRSLAIPSSVIFGHKDNSNSESLVNVFIGFKSSSVRELQLMIGGREEEYQC